MINNDIKGPEGWWLDEKNVDVQKTIKAEQAKLDELGQDAPLMLTARPPKAASETAIKGLRLLQEVDGITDGVDLRYLEPMAFGGKFLNWKAQIVGSCVESSSNRARVSRTLAEILIHGQLEGTFGDDLTSRKNIATFGPYSYRAGRMLGGLNSGDGSFLGSQQDGLRRFGCCPCDTEGLRSDAWPEPQDMVLYRRYGNSNSILDQFADVARQWNLLESSALKSADDFKRASVDQFKPANIASLWAFEPSHKSGEWTIYRRSRQQWAHQVTLCGCVEYESKWYAIVRNSWGQNAHSGRDWFPIPLELLDDWAADRNSVCMTMGELELPDTPTIVT